MESHLENKKDLLNVLFLFFIKKRFKWDIYLIKSEKVLLIKLKEGFFS